jgi:threonine aldolase
MQTYSTIDLRSDTLTRPTAEMRHAIAEAPVGDDCYGDDPSVKALEEKVAALCGKEAALFMPSGTMSNQVALRLHTRPGDEVITDAAYHIAYFESAQSCALAGVSLHVANCHRGILTIDAIDERFSARPRGPSYANPSLLWLENTISCSGGTVFPLDKLQRVTEHGRSLGMKIHLDGARLWNASVASGVSLRRFAACADTITLCFSKGLGAPVGAVLVGSASDIHQARRFRKWYGGAMHQAGMMAAGALYGINHHLPQLRRDHDNASLFASMLHECEPISLPFPVPETNMVYFTTPAPVKDCLAECAARGVLLFPWTDGLIRAVFHLNVTTEETIRAAKVISNVAVEQAYRLGAPATSQQGATTCHQEICPPIQ